jgi:hypothetical protein
VSPLNLFRAVTGGLLGIGVLQAIRVGRVSLLRAALCFGVCLLFGCRLAVKWRRITPLAPLMLGLGLSAMWIAAVHVNLNPTGTISGALTLAAILLLVRPEAAMVRAARLNSQAQSEAEKGWYPHAERSLEQAVAASVGALGPAHPTTLALRNNLAVLYMNFGRGLVVEVERIKDAEMLLKQTLTTQQGILGDRDPDTLQSMRNLADNYSRQERYAEAELLLERELATRKTVQGIQHPDTLASFQQLATLYMTQGRYAETEALLRQRLAALEKVQSKIHPATLDALDECASFYCQQERYVEAESLYKRALMNRETLLGIDHPDTLAAMNRLAMLYAIQKQYTDAEQLYKRVIDAASRILQTLRTRNQTAAKHSMRQLEEAYLIEKDFNEVEGTALDGMTTFYFSQGRYHEAVPWGEKALAAHERVLGANHPTTLMSINSLAYLYSTERRNAEAEALFKKLAQARKHFSTEIGLTWATNLAVLYAASHRAEEAFQLIRQVQELQTGILWQLSSVSSSEQSVLAIEQAQAKFDIFLSLLCRDSAQHVQAAADLVLRRKRLDLEIALTRRAAQFSGPRSRLEPLIRDAAVLRKQVTRQSMAGRQDIPSPATYAEELGKLSEHLEWRERELAKEVHKELASETLASALKDWNTFATWRLTGVIPGSIVDEELREVTRQAVASALPHGSTLVEFLRFNVFDPEAISNQKETWKPARYVAFAIPSGDGESVRMIDLGEAEPIDQMITTFRRSLTGEADLGSVEVRADLDVHAIGRRLRCAILDPVTREVADRRLLLAPDAGLCLCPFEVLPNEDGSLVMDDFQISYLGTGRDLVRLRKKPAVIPEPDIVAADPDFRLKRENVKSDDATSDRSQRHGASARAHQIRGSGLTFDPLPGTRKEGERIGKLLRVEPWMDKSVLKSKLGQCRSPRILHIATHGFFLPDPRRDPNRDWQVGFLGGFHRLQGPGMENPMLRSGLALAGAQTWVDQGEPPEEAEDGLLTAEDVTAMDLRGTELVVLSACDTGVGEVRIGLGVFGLRRAFELAGARTLVVSLWKVPDDITRELMERFYSNLVDGKDRLTALRLAQAEIRRSPHHPSPAEWGAFICQGETGPMF